MADVELSKIKELAESNIQIDDKDNYDDEDDDDDEEEEAEPLFKYSRLRNDFITIMQENATTCFNVNPKFLAVGTDFGAIYVLDTQGNLIKKYDQIHGAAIRDISVDTSGDVLGSCSDDGKVSIITVFSNANPIIHSFDRPAKSIALAPKYSRLKSKGYVIGYGDRLSRVTGDWLGRNKSHIIDSGEGPITSINWRGRFMAWANNKFFVKVQDMVADQLISVVERPQHTSQSFRPELFPTIIDWIDDVTFVIGSIDSVKICSIKEQAVTGKTQLLATNFPLYYVEIVTNFKVADAYIGGLVPYDSKMAVLCLPTPEAVQRDRKETEECGDLEWDEEEAMTPQLRVIADLFAKEKKEEHCYTLPIKDFQKYRYCDYDLVKDDTESQLFIMTPKAILVAAPRSEDDHVDWMIAHERFEAALAMTVQSKLTRHTTKSVGLKYLNYLINNGEYELAALKVTNYIGKDKQSWEEVIEKFKHAQQLKKISYYVPTGEFRLDQYVYELILDDYLKTDIEGFYTLIKTWSKDLYQFEAMAAVVTNEVTSAEQKLLSLNRQLEQVEAKKVGLQQMKDHNADLASKMATLKKYSDSWRKQAIVTKNQLRNLRAALAMLYCQAERYEDAISTYLDLGHEDVFDLIDKYNLYEVALKRVPRLIELQEDRAMKMLLQNTEKMPIGIVVKQLENHKKLQLAYLDELFQKDHNLAKDHHELQVELYAEYNPNKLLQFLKKSTYYSLKKAYTICKERNYYPEMVFLLDRMGSSEEALDIIINNLQDVDYAIEFAKEKDEHELWKKLIAFSMDKPNFIRGLLHNVGSHINPVMIVEKIPLKLKIPGLRDSLVKILHDYKLQISLQEGCKKILVNDSVSLFDKLTKTRRKGFYIDEFTKCPCCQGGLLCTGQDVVSDSIVFFCRHAYHKDCLPVREREFSCQLCSNAMSNKKRSIRD